MRWLAVALMFAVVSGCACESRREVRTSFPELVSVDPEEQAASDVVRLPADHVDDRRGTRDLAEEILGVPVHGVRVGGAVGPPVPVSVRIGDADDERPKLVFSYASRRLLYVDSMRRPYRGGYMSSDARLLGDELIEKCFPKIPALLMFHSEERRDGVWVVAWVGVSSRPGVAVTSGDVASVRMSAETGRLIWYRQWIAPLRPDPDDFVRDCEAFTRRGRAEVAAHGLDPKSYKWGCTLVLSWAEHPQAGPVWAVIARGPRPETWVETDRERDGTINLVFDARTDELLAARERDWWDFDPAQAEARLVDAGVMPGRHGARVAQ